MAADLRQLIARLDGSQRLWLSGYLAGSLAQAPAELATAPGSAPAGPPLATILYGSHSGNSESVAQQLGETLTRRGLSFRILDMLDCRKNHLQEASNVLVIVSTHGEGDPPERAVPLHELLHGRKAPRLDHVNYSVLALGDSSYERFCETGRQFDDRMQSLGAKRLHDRVECDVDFQAPAQRWVDAVADALAAAHPSAAPQATAFFAGSAGTERAASPIANAYTRKNPFLAPVLLNQRLTAGNSSKDVRHIELSIEGSNLHYEPGDALGIVPRNQAREVDAVLAALEFAAEQPVTVGGTETSLRQALLEHFEIGLLSRTFLDRYAKAVSAPALTRLLAAQQPEILQRYLHGRHLIDLIKEHPPQGLDASAFVQLLPPLAPRLYSLASSLQATPDEAHLTVSIVKYHSLGRQRQGVVSGWLGALEDEDAHAPIYLQRNPAFRLPASHDTPIIMIGPGTGVAPFRAFLAEREALGAQGANWLFFGDRNFHYDFLYQTEWLQWRKNGLLNRIDVAFSRDNERKQYVQHRMLEQGKELFAWLQEGAHLYVCGDAQSMAPDVDRVLHQIIEHHGALSSDQAVEQVLDLQRQRRYQKDVY
ncbi:sulfite reductase (NADPH) flavoprotein alpha-component [Steroidobacter denitrificans]|uniref:Sulfite reductase [NADPH] flavoprotein alpha-component n=1 Tax=Steroidobacter denitrificans TaxID=465721 RepID=A0A127FDE6_STEDE|nr:sulfite reductase (NADPH) flavoprotein alpha-component [Steroidobacter denitrificans]